MIEVISAKFKNMKTIYVFEWICLSLILIFSFFSFNHGDLLATSTHGLYLLKYTLEGNFFSFYDLTNNTAFYSIPIYILFAIWSIPVFIILVVFNLPFWDCATFAVPQYFLWWYKLLPVIFCAGTVYIVYRILKSQGFDVSKLKWCIFIFIGFPILVFSLFIFGQYDSICMFFSLLSIYFYLNNKMLKFSITAAVAITFKVFFALVFIPLLLLREKKILSILKYLVIAISLYLICNLLFWSSPGFQHVNEFNNIILERFYNSSLNVSMGSISIFIIAYIGICIYSYLNDVGKGQHEITYKTFYISLLVYTILFSFVLWHPQWLILLVPFWVVMMFYSRSFRFSTLISIALGLSYIAVTVYSYTNNVDEVLIRLGIFNLSGCVQFAGGRLHNLFGLIDYRIWLSVFIACLIYNAIYLFPTKNNIKESKNIVKKSISCSRLYIWCLVLVIFAYIAPVIYIYIRNCL